jgi:hypothetical protein
MIEPERKFLQRIARLIPDAAGYRPLEGRRDTERRVREHVARALEELRVKIGELKAASQEEGEEDMMEDLDRIDARMDRTIEALRGAQYDGAAFLDRADLPEEALGKICSYDRELLDDLELLRTDVTGLKYETIGNLTLREAEGTLAAIELKVTNRKYLFEATGGADA